jgi:hypothetical protein
VSIKISSSLTLDATEVRVVWAAAVTVYDVANEEDVLEIETMRRPFRIDQEAEAATWCEQTRAALARQYAVTA